MNAPWVAGLDRDALQAWSSPGVVARAEQDRAASPPTLGPSGGPAVIVNVEGWAVRIPPEGWQHTWCPCPSWTPCRHAVAALLFAQAGLPTEAASTVQVADELEAIGQAGVEAWAGARATEDAWRLLAAGMAVELDVSAGRLLGRVSELDAEVRFVAGSGLDGVMCTAPAASLKRTAAMVLLAFLQERGVAKAPASVTQISLRGAAGAARTPNEVIAATQALLRETVAVGLAHLSGAIVERFATAGVSAHAARLVRLGKALDTLHDDATRLTDRHAAGDEGRLLARMARTYALCAALQRAGADAPDTWVGRARARYLDVPQLRLAGLGARVLVSNSGTVGLVGCFRDLDRPRWLTMADVRPADRMMGFEPRRRYRIRDVWGEHSFEELSRSVVHVEGAKVSADGRLSASSSTRAHIVGPTLASVPKGLEIEDFAQVRAGANAAFSLGLTPPTAHRALMVLRPARWLPPVFDEVAQRLTAIAADAGGRRVSFRLRYDDLNAPTIEALEAWRPTALDRLLVEIEAPGPTPRAHLVSALTTTPKGLSIWSPSLDGAAVRAATATPLPASGPEVDASEPADARDGLANARRWLEEIAEGGVVGRGLAAPPSLEAFRQAGLRSAASALGALSSDPSPHALLAARYVLELAEGAAER